jgi:NAD(P)-dependent dehydrogenase (short-subunit alcohol dehydrogenase family)
VVRKRKQIEGSSKMTATIDRERFGPWALITGASSGIGKEFARQIAASGINVVLVARRETALIEVGRSIAKDFKVQYRVIVMDLSQEGFIPKLAEHTKDLDIGCADLAAGIRRVKGVKKLGVRLGNWLTTEQGQALWQAPDHQRLKVKRDRALLALIWSAREATFEQFQFLIG